MIFCMYDMYDWFFKLKFEHTTIIPPSLMQCATFVIEQHIQLVATMMHTKPIPKSGKVIQKQPIMHYYSYHVTCSYHVRRHGTR